MRCGAAEGTRTPDPIITNDVLYQLSYCGVPRGLAPSGAGEKGGGEIRGAGARALCARVQVQVR